MADPLEIVDHLGIERKLGWIPPTSENLMMRAAKQNFTDYLSSLGKTLIPRADWQPISRRKLFGPEFVNDQKSCSGCSGWSGVQGLMRLRKLYGMTFQRLSGAFPYSQVNGNRDAGSVILDVDKVLESQGTCLESEFNFPHIFDRDIPQPARETAKRFRLLQSLTLDTFNEAATAIQLGFIVCFPIQVGRNFEQFDNGVAGVSAGYGNHAVHAFGLVNINGKWYLEMGNSWSPLWGPFKDGTCLLAEAAFAGQGGNDDSYVQISPTSDPSDPNLPPAPVP